MDIKRYAQNTYLYLVLSSLLFGILFSFVHIPYFSLISYAVMYLPPIIMLFIRRYPIKASLSLKPVPISQLLIAAVLAICGTIVVIISNNIINYPPSANNSLVTSLANYSLWPNMLIWIAGAILIELVYRGIIQNGFQHLAPLKLIFIISLLYAFPGSVFRAPATIIIGVIYSLLVFKTGSVIPAVGAHIIVSFLKQPLSHLIYNISLMWGKIPTLVIFLLAAIGIAILLLVKMPGAAFKGSKDAEKTKLSPGFIVALVIAALYTIWNIWGTLYFMSLY